MAIAHKIALDPNSVQATYLARASGTARFAYNWRLSKWTRQHCAHKVDPNLPAPNEGAIGRQLNAIKRQQFPWMLSVTKNAPQMAIRQLGIAFKNFFAKHAHFPVFRKKRGRDRFSITNDKFQLDGARIRIPVLGWVKMREALRFTGKAMSATVTRTADCWYVSILVRVTDIAHLPPAENQDAVGMDFGLTAFATLSTGGVITGPKAYKLLQAKLKRLSRSLCRKQKGAANRLKAKTKLARLHARITNIRKDAQHKFTSDLTRRQDTIGIEELLVKGMMQNHSLAASICLRRNYPR